MQWYCFIWKIRNNMTNFNECLKEGKAKKALVDKIRAKSLIKYSIIDIENALKISLNESTLRTIFRELYEGLREYIEAIGFLNGYKFLDHISITHFLKDVLNEEVISEKFDRYRKIRNRINYYGDPVSMETVKEIISSIQEIIKYLNRHLINI